MQSLLAEFDHENASTRKILERLPDEHFDWQPHAKSFTLGKLATHLATMPGWTKITLAQDELDFAKPMDRPTPTNREEILSVFDAAVASSREVLASTTEDVLTQPWTMRNGDQVFFTMPKGAVLRDMCFNHTVHHRGQLSVYLRLLDVPVPGMYGPSADER